jgi:two-component system sensor histidine kinase ChvG
VLVDLGRVIGGVIQIQCAILANRDLKIILTSHDLTITADLLAGLFVLGTEGIIETVLENLIDYAASLSPPGGEILVRLTRDGSFAHLTVTDQGPEVPSGQLGQIFDRYYSGRHAEAWNGAPESDFGIELWAGRML